MECTYKQMINNKSIQLLHSITTKLGIQYAYMRRRDEEKIQLILHRCYVFNTFLNDIVCGLIKKNFLQMFSTKYVCRTNINACLTIIITIIYFLCTHFFNSINKKLMAWNQHFIHNFLSFLFCV